MEEKDKPATKGDLTDMQQTIAEMLIEERKDIDTKHKEWLEESKREHNERMDKMDMRMDKMDQANKDFMTWMVQELAKKEDKK